MMKNLKKHLIPAFFLAAIIFTGGGKAIQCQTACEPNELTTSNIGIHESAPNKPLVVGGNIICPDVAIQLRYEPEIPYVGHLALTTATNFSNYTKLKPSFLTGGIGDVVLQAETAKDLILTTRKNDGFLRFATTPAANGPDFERMTIAPNGYIGVGLLPPTNPMASLDVNVTQWTNKIRLQLHSSNNYPSLRIYRGGLEETSIGWWLENSSDNNGSLLFKKTDVCTLDNPASQTTTTFVAIKDNGNFGIGYTNPLYKLNVNGNVGIGFTTPSSDNEQKLAVNGKVRIGTDEVSPNSVYYNAYKLSVDGTILCEELIVSIAAGWADFVFKNDYKLMPLDVLEAKIKKDGRLPDIPSEAEVTEKGIKYSEMQVKLLQKVEELTLYMIELNKENKALKSKLDELQYENNKNNKSKKQ